ncbi:MAG: hypothetical protein M1605_03145 [Candidatus Thermoplasmatota archaeon]|nr:hypothetical protein [Candidatus Thermoplasmatota archaeon]
MPNMTPVIRKKKRLTFRGFRKRLRHAWILLLAILLVAVGFVSSHIYYPQREIVTKSYYSTVAVGQNNSTLTFPAELYKGVNFTFSLQPNKTVSYWLYHLAIFAPPGKKATSLLYIISAGDVSNGSVVVGTPIYGPEIYLINLRTSSGSFNVTITESVVFNVVTAQPEWLTIFSFLSIFAGAVLGAAYLTVIAAKKEKGKVQFSE